MNTRASSPSEVSVETRQVSRERMVEVVMNQFRIVRAEIVRRGLFTSGFCAAEAPWAGQQQGMDEHSEDGAALYEALSRGPV